MKFKVGDYIKIKKNCKQYALTTPGSTGTIKRIISEEEVEIKFDFLTSENREDLKRTTYGIYVRDIELVLKEVKQFGIVKFMESINV